MIGQAFRRGTCCSFISRVTGLSCRIVRASRRDGYNETIVPCDFHRGVRHITDDEVWAAIVRPLPSGMVRVRESSTFRRWRRPLLRMYRRSGRCRRPRRTRKNPGAMTKSLLAAYKERCRSTSSSSTITYADLLDAIHVQLRRKGFPQKPQMTSLQRFDAQTRVFSISRGVIIANKNEQIGRKKTRHFRPGRPTNRARDGGINDILVGAAIRATVLGAIGEALFLSLKNIFLSCLERKRT